MSTKPCVFTKVTALLVSLLAEVLPLAVPLAVCSSPIQRAWENDVIPTCLKLERIEQLGSNWR